MRRLNREKLSVLLASRGINLSGLAEKAGVSRQSLYLLFKGAPIYSSAFVRIMEALGVPAEAITEEAREGFREAAVMRRAPLKIRKACLELAEFCRRRSAALVLMGSRAAGRAREGADWDFGVAFEGRDHDRDLRRLKMSLVERSFPYRMDVVNLTRAPDWFRVSVRGEAVPLVGSWPENGGRA